MAGSATTAAALLAADELFGAPDADATKPNPALEKLGAVALAEAKKQGATYCDIRINRYRNQFSGYRLSPERGGTKTDEVPFVNDGSSFGFGVRVIAERPVGIRRVAAGDAGGDCPHHARSGDGGQGQLRAPSPARGTGADQRLRGPLDFALSRKIRSPCRWTKSWS